MVLEVRDARIPHTSQNITLDEILGSKPRLVVLNKSDLADHWWVVVVASSVGPAALLLCGNNRCHTMFLLCRALRQSVSILEQQGVEVLTTDLKSGKVTLELFIVIFVIWMANCGTEES